VGKAGGPISTSRTTPSGQSEESKERGFNDPEPGSICRKPWNTDLGGGFVVFREWERSKKR